MTLRRRSGPSRPAHGPRHGTARHGTEKLRAPPTDSALGSSPVDPLTEKQIRTSFVNSTKGEAARLRLPLDFAELPWPDLDFLGWVDPGAPLRAHLVV
ncbi:MAG: FBP domain-containing protein, partial [Streptomyces albidoflavus]